MKITNGNLGNAPAHDIARDRASTADLQLYCFEHVAVANVTEVKAVIDASPKGALVLTGPTFSGGVLGLGTTNVAPRPTDENLRKAFDTAMDAVNRDGTNTALSEKWFGVDISIHQ